MSRYDYEQLGPQVFEKFSVALAVARLGVALQVFGSGRGGGREATYEGSLTTAQTGATQTWSGLTVVQAKQKEHLSEVGENARWLRGQIRGEVKKWALADGSKPVPNNLLLITNARLSAAAGVDDVVAYCKTVLDEDFGSSGRPKTARSRGMRSLHVWHRDSVDAYLDAAKAVRDAFHPLLTTGDVLSRIGQIGGPLTEGDFRDAMVQHAASALRYERWVRFAEIGAGGRQSVEQIIVDLPARDEGKKDVLALRTIFSKGENVLRATTRLPGDRPHVVLTGSPGNGKSTISTFVAQAYRTLFLDDDSVAPDMDALRKDTHEVLSRFRVESRVRRWPIRLNLADMATSMGPQGGPSLRRYMANVINERADAQVTAASLGTWLVRWPTIVLFDGLDEVTSPQVRSRVIEEIREFALDCEGKNADVFIVLTTRPTGYNERFLPELFEQLDLSALHPAQAVVYGLRVAALRMADDDIMQRKIVAEFQVAAKTPAIENLLATPLQVLILLIILETLGELPASRFELFNGYFEAMYRRESQKQTSYHRLVSSHKQDIMAIHERVALMLQVQCEGTEDPRARLPLSVLTEVARDLLVDKGFHATDEAPQMAADFTQIATTRLVLLVPDEDETVSFEVRSLQEMMAARALVAGDDDGVRRALIQVLPSPHWRNSWLFAAGKLFAESDHRRELVLSIVEENDSNGGWVAGGVMPLCPGLAASMLDDGMAATHPNARRRLVDVALRVLDGPRQPDLAVIAKGLAAACTTGTERLRVRAAFEQAFAGSPEQRAMAASMVWWGDFGSTIPGEPGDLKAYTREWVPRDIKTGSVSLTSNLDAAFEVFQDEHPDACDDLQRLLDALRPQRLRRGLGGRLVPPEEIVGIDPSLVLPVLADEEMRWGLEFLLHSVSAADWVARDVASLMITLPLLRLPVGRGLDFNYLGALD